MLRNKQGGLWRCTDLGWILNLAIYQRLCDLGRCFRWECIQLQSSRVAQTSRWFFLRHNENPRGKPAQGSYRVLSDPISSLLPGAILGTQLSSSWFQCGCCIVRPHLSVIRAGKVEKGSGGGGSSSIRKAKTSFENLSTYVSLARLCHVAS